MEKTKLIVVCGPTASGKTRLSVDIAKKLGNAEVINADSMQVYSGMDIAVAMPCAEEMAGVPHHLFGFIPPERAFSVAEWLDLARAKIVEVDKRGNIPIIVGGTGLYVSSLIDNVVFDEVGIDYTFREEMYALARKHGNKFLHDKLKSVDSEIAERLHMNNVKRIIRALETFRHSRTFFLERIEQSRAKCSPYDTCVFGIGFSNRQTLYDRINVRVDSMVEAGLVEEAQQRLSAQIQAISNTAQQAIGHKELLPYFINDATLEVCIEKLKMKTRNYAKRQLTWFRKIEQLNWLVMNDFAEYVHILQKATSVLCDKFFLKKS
jgi:tRNA dimethylallyltransferase